MTQQYLETTWKELIDICKANMGRAKDEKEEKLLIPINNIQGVCQCEACRKMDTPQWFETNNWELVKTK